MQSFLKSKQFQAINILPIGAILILAHLTKSSFEGVCAIVALLFWFVQLWLFSIMSSRKSQKKKFKASGYLLLFPSIMMIGIAILLLLNGFPTISSSIAYTFIGLSNVLSLCLILQVIVHWSNNGPVGKFFKWTSLASLAVPMSIVIVVLLYITGSNYAITLSCLTVIIMGSLALLTAINMVLVSSCGYISTIDSIKAMSRLLCFVLTQTAIMSFANEGDNSFYNALSGVVFGSLATLIGLFVIIDSFSIRKKYSNDDSRH